MSTPKNMENELEELGQAIGPDESLVGNVMSRIDARPVAESNQTDKSKNKLLLRRFIMNRFTKLAAAAVIVIAVLIGIHLYIGSFDLTSRAYAITDVPELLRTARTLHTQRTLWRYADIAKQGEFVKATVIPLELWLDVPNMRERFVSYEVYTDANGERRWDRTDGFRDREYALDIRHGQRTLRYNKVSLIKRRLQMRRVIHTQYLNSVSAEIGEDYTRYVIVGQEDIDGITFDIWQREDTESSDDRPPKKVRCWLSPTTGEIGRIYVWGKSNSGTAKWRPEYFVETIERNIDIPDSVFEFAAPEDYQYQNTKETAFVAEGLGAGWFTMGGARVSVAINFTLDDGSVIVAWHSDDLQLHYLQEQEHLFESLNPGGELPKLPMAIYGLKSGHLERDSAPEGSYVGRHLGFTKKAGWYYEWALYVPEGQFRGITDGGWYRMLCRFNLATEQEPEVGNPMPENRIESGDFDTFVLGAMAELSDDGKAPEHITYENVMQLAEQIRESLVE